MIKDKPVRTPIEPNVYCILEIFPKDKYILRIKSTLSGAIKESALLFLQQCADLKCVKFRISGLIRTEN
ncbi:hypothetical protein GCM10011386_15810 [Parapedobacter defluvii]|uniref:Uncharacterized protein n=1 Tax=Parapedobacter defluvii TaxID=2045106 RepID=A0ABQ1LJD0_9SPHI|nr:hypothetical protein GCM10011386_15810 [Parapedobacter defluvii]